MSKVTVLPSELASQIAAGEVVERPASAVKELVENSIDAGATRCDVEIAGGGVTLIRVRDDGEGMDEDDARRCIERHATSKLLNLADLRALRSFGFRGEALPSIASVSRFTLRSRPRDRDAGLEVSVTGGGPPTVRPLGLAIGTEIEVRDLYFNVPARRKFLRSTGTEAGHVTDVLEALTLARPEMTFTLIRDGRKVREWLRVSSREERAAATTEEELVHCQGERGPLRVEAFLSRPDRARTGAGGLKILVNGRAIRDRAVAVTVAQAYGSVLERGHYPRGVVYLELPLELVDVNVHPQKAEVRFADPRAVNDALYGVLSRELARGLSLPVPSRSQWGSKPAPAPPRPTQEAERQPDPDLPVKTPRPLPGPLASAAGWGGPTAAPSVKTERPAVTLVETPLASNGGTHDSSPVSPGEGAATQRPASEPLIALRDSGSAPLRPHPAVRWSNLRFIAQVRQTFLVCEGADGLYVLDQHAAAERVGFSRLRAAYRARDIASQSLLFPLAIELSAEEVELVEAHAGDIAGVGLDLRLRGPHTLSIHAVPRLLERASPERLVRDLLGEISRAGGRGFSDAIDLHLASMACHGAVRAGDRLSDAEATALLRALDQADFAGFCPHGRPVVSFTGWSELERKVGRR